MAILRVQTVNPADQRTLRRGSNSFGAGRLRVGNLIKNNVDLDRTYAVRSRNSGLPEVELRNILSRVLSPEYGFQPGLGGCSGCGGGLGETAAPDAQAVQLAKEALALFKSQRARAKSKYNSLVAAINKQIAADLACVKKYQDSTAYKSYVKAIRATMPKPTDIPAVLSVAGAVLRYLKVNPDLYRAGTNCAVLDSKGKQPLTHGAALAVYLHALRAAAPAARLEKLKRLLNPISDEQMLAEIQAGKFTLFSDSCGHQYIHSAGELSGRNLSDVDEDWKEIYVVKCPGKSTFDILKEIAVPAAIMIAFPAAINYLATGSVGWIGSGAAASAAPAASSATAIPAGAAAAPAAAAPVLSTAAPVAASVPVATAATATAPAIISKVADTVATAAPIASQVAQAAQSVQAARASEPMVIPITDGQETPSASAANWLIPALIGGGLLLFTMRG